MSQPLTATDLLPLVARLAPQERKRLVRLIEDAGERDAALYLASPVKPGEFASDEDPLAWDADGWDQTP
jgi:hypothetical protein